MPRLIPRDTLWYSDIHSIQSGQGGEGLIARQVEPALPSRTRGQM
jgi:hypothetical protein